MSNVGVAFSGGGIRSAAFTSGVLRRLLESGAEFHYLSCVSGGGFTGAAFLDWKYRSGEWNNRNWHEEFFKNMRSRAGYICSWERPLQGILESIILIFLLIIVNLLIPCVIYSAGAIPSAYVIDYVLGTVMRKGFKCTDVPQNSRGLNTTERHCTRQFEIGQPEARGQLYLFFFLFLAFFVSYFIKTIVPIRLRSIARYFKILSGSLLALTLFPWLIEQFTGVLPSWLSALIIILSIFFWLGFPPLRGEVSLVLMTYFYAFVVKWRVYETSVMGIVYEEQLFYTLLLISGFCLWLTPFLGMFSTTAGFTYYKWRLQRAFFTEKSVGWLGCKGIGCRDFFPILSCNCSEHNPDKEPLIMADLVDIKPEYTSCVAVDYWRKQWEESPYAVMALSPTKIERIDGPKVKESSHPEYVSVADAMVTSGAVMTRNPEQDEPIRDLQVHLGLTLRKGITLSDPDDALGCGQKKGRIASKIITILIQSIVAVPIILLAVIWFSSYKMKAEGVAIALFVAYLVTFFGIAMLPTGGESRCSCLDSFARWCHVHLYHVRMLREFFQVDHVGSSPPALLSLSDGGRLEKFGLLPLLKKRLKRILIVDGSYIRSDEDYAKEILRSMDQARKDLNCEFLGEYGRDVKQEMREKYVDLPRGDQPRSYRFKVQYDGREQPNESSEREGEIMIIAPRHPEDGVKSSPEITWQEPEGLNTELWGASPVLSEEDVNQLTFCCCECCHCSSKVCQGISEKLCMRFPHTTTANQFFTPSHFTAYHREGYRACVESEAERFLANESNAEEFQRGSVAEGFSGNGSAHPPQTDSQTHERNLHGQPGDRDAELGFCPLNVPLNN